MLKLLDSDGILPQKEGRKHTQNMVFDGNFGLEAGRRHSRNKGHKWDFPVKDRNILKIKVS